MAKRKRKNAAAVAMAKKRWAGTTKAERIAASQVAADGRRAQFAADPAAREQALAALQKAHAARQHAREKAAIPKYS